MSSPSFPVCWLFGMHFCYHSIKTYPLKLIVIIMFFYTSWISDNNSKEMLLIDWLWEHKFFTCNLVLCIRFKFILYAPTQGWWIKEMASLVKRGVYLCQVPPPVDMSLPQIGQITRTNPCYKELLPTLPPPPPSIPLPPDQPLVITCCPHSPEPSASQSLLSWCFCILNSILKVCTCVTSFSSQTWQWMKHFNDICISSFATILK